MCRFDARTSRASLSSPGDGLGAAFGKCHTAAPRKSCGRK